MENDYFFENVNLLKIINRGKYKKLDKFNKYLIWIIIILFIIDVILTFINIKYHYQHTSTTPKKFFKYRFI